VLQIIAWVAYVAVAVTLFIYVGRRARKGSPAAIGSPPVGRPPLGASG
jgi:hypothetical protein